MYSTKYIRELSSQSILSLVSEYDLFVHYVRKPFSLGATVHSPFREEDRPSFVIYKTSYGKYSLRYTDQATGEHGSCFDLVMKLYNCTFYDALRIIDKDFKLNLAFGRIVTTEPVKVYSSIEMSIREKQTIGVGVRQWNGLSDKEYWGAYGITCATLVKYNVYPLSHVNVGSTQYKCDNMTYGYYFGDGMWKIYSPYSTRQKWISNVNKTVIQGFKELTTQGDVLVITKALKEVMLFAELGISAIAPQSETVLIDEDTMVNLKKRFSSIYVNFDYDFTGVTNGNKYRKIFDIDALYFTNGRFGTTNYGAKDASDFAKLHGVGKLIEIINNLKQKES